MLGATRHELAHIISKRFELPNAISSPIAEYLHNGPAGRVSGRLATVLKMADLYANGLLLATSEQSVVAPLSRTEVRTATGKDDVCALDSSVVRAEVFSLTAMLVHLPSEVAKLISPIYATGSKQILLARDASIATFDPVFAACQCLAHVTVRDELPSPQQLDSFDGLIVVSRNTSAAGFSAAAISRLTASRASGRPPSTLWLTGNSGEDSSGYASLVTWPVSLRQLADFVVGLDQRK
jgi:hypothetical protein